MLEAARSIDRCEAHGAVFGPGELETALMSGFDAHEQHMDVRQLC